MLPRRLFDSAQLTAVAATYYTSTNCRTIVTSLLATNSTASARTVTVYIIKSGGTAGVTNIVVSARTILPGQTVELLDKNKHMEQDDFVQALADSAAAVTFHGSGYQVPLGA